MKRPRRQYFVVLPQGEKVPMQQWFRRHPDHIPQGVGGVPFPKLIIGLKQNGWEVKETDTEVHLIFPTKEKEVNLETVIDLLREAMSEIAPPGAWTQGTLARTASGGRASISDSQASQFCMVGALRRAISNLNVSDEILLHAYKIVHEEIRAANSETGAANPRNVTHESAIIGYNDSPTRKQREVVDVFDNAIFEAEIQEFEQLLSELDTTVDQAVEYVSSHASKQRRLGSREGYKPTR